MDGKLYVPLRHHPNLLNQISLYKLADSLIVCQVDLDWCPLKLIDRDECAQTPLDVLPQGYSVLS